MPQMRSYALILVWVIIVVVCVLPASASDDKQLAIIGCLSRLPDGSLQLGAMPSGTSYSVRGDQMLLAQHVNQIVRASTDAPPSTGHTALTIYSLQVIVESCTSVSSGSKTESVAGKVGADVTAVPVSTSRSADETTPGYQTESDQTQWTGGDSGNRYLHTRAVAPAFGPAQPEQAAESQQAADRNAQAAMRAEILPGNTLGVNGKQPPADTNAGQAQSLSNSCTGTPQCSGTVR